MSLWEWGVYMNQLSGELESQRLQVVLRPQFWCRRGSSATIRRTVCRVISFALRVLHLGRGNELRKKLIFMLAPLIPLEQRPGHSRHVAARGRKMPRPAQPGAAGGE